MTCLHTFQVYPYFLYYYYTHDDFIQGSGSFYEVLNNKANLTAIKADVKEIVNVVREPHQADAWKLFHERWTVSEPEFSEKFKTSFGLLSFCRGDFPAGWSITDLLEQ